MATGAYDSEGIWQYGDDDAWAPTKGLLNKLAASVTAAFIALKATMGVSATASGTATATGTLGADLTYTGASLVLPAGTWVIEAAMSLINTVTTDSVCVSITNVTAGTEVTAARGLTDIATTAAAINVESRPTVVTLAATTTFAPRGVRNGGSTLRAQTQSATLGPAAYIHAVRIK